MVLLCTKIWILFGILLFLLGQQRYNGITYDSKHILTNNIAVSTQDM